VNGLRIASLIGMVGMLTLPNSPQFYVMCTTAATVIGSVIVQIIQNRERARQYQRDRQERVAQYERDRQERLDHQADLRLEVERVAMVARAATADIKGKIEENTNLTKEGIVRTAEFAEAANHMNEKIASLALTANQVTEVALDTNQTVHGIQATK